MSPGDHFSPRPSLVWVCLGSFSLAFSSLLLSEISFFFSPITQSLPSHLLHSSLSPQQLHQGVLNPEQPKNFVGTHSFYS